MWYVFFCIFGVIVFTWMGVLKERRNEYTEAAMNFLWAILWLINALVRISHL